MDTNTEKPIRIYPIEWVFFVALMGGIAVFALFFSNIWNENGLISDWFSGARFLTVFAAIALGLVIGWMVFPRVPTDAIRPVLGDPNVAPDGSLWPRADGGTPVDLSGTGRTMERDQTKPDTIDGTGPAGR